MSSSVGPEPSRLICPHCRMPVLTRTEPISSTKTHLLAVLLCGLCCWPCACCLYCTDCARNMDHFCPACNSQIGTYER